MNQLLWLTDIHFNFLALDQIADFLETVNQHPAEVVIISGDLTEAPQLPIVLKMLERFVAKPIYFVLGNHDYYYSSTDEIRDSLPQWLQSRPTLTWLTQAGVIALTPQCALIGHDGWADGRYGNYHTSPMILNDFMLIEDLHLPLTEDRLQRMHTLGDQAAAHFYQWLPLALQQYPQVIVVTHVPPFAESALKNGQPMNEIGLPFYANRAAGDALRDIAQLYPHREIIVLSGHTHSAADVQILPNLRVMTGHAEYRKPEIQSVVVKIR